MTRRKLFLFSIILLTGFFFLISGEKDIWTHIFSIVALALASCCVVKFDIYHPMCLYVSMFALYSVGYAIIYDFGIVTRFGYSKEAMACMWLALIIITLLLPKKRINLNITFNDKGYQRFDKILLLLSNVLSFLTFASLIYIIKSGYVGKSDIYENGGIVINLICKMVYFNMMYITLYLLKMLIDHDKFKIGWFLFNVSSVALFGAVTGERDYLFHILLIVCLCLSIVNIVKKKQIPLLIIAGILLVTLTKSFKYIFLTGEGSGEFATSGIILSFIDGEFSSAGRNMQVLVDGNYYDYFGGYSLLMDIIRIFYDFGFSTIKWFNDTVLDYISTGYGFTLVGEGYINGGYWGIVLVVSISTLILRALYLRAADNFYFMAIYIYMLPQFIYSTRADITSILSPLIKHVFLGLAILFILDFIFGNKNKKRKIIKG